MEDDMDIAAVLGVVLFSAFLALWFVGPFVFAGWARARREETVKRQIALTEAIHRDLGSLVSPVVRRPLWGPWQIRIAVPFSRPATVGSILALAHEAIAVGDWMNRDDYEIVLTPQSRNSGAEPARRAQDRLAA
jgi:hypothetical protein